LNYPIYHFDCECDHEEDSENILKGFYDQERRKWHARKTCKTHSEGKVVEKSIVCANENCKAVFRVSIKANNASFCKECRPDLAAQRQKLWRKVHKGYSTRFYKRKNDEDEEEELLVIVPEIVIYPEVNRSDVVPCIQGEGCSHKDYDKNNKICVNCVLRIAYVKCNSYDRYSKQSESYNLITNHRSYKTAKS